MKLQAELLALRERLSEILPAIREHAGRLKSSGDYKDFYTRLAWDCLHAVTTPAEVCEWYSKYNCNDAHIDTLVKNALKAVYPAE